MMNTGSCQQILINLFISLKFTNSLVSILLCQMGKDQEEQIRTAIIKHGNTQQDHSDLIRRKRVEYEQQTDHKRDDRGDQRNPPFCVPSSPDVKRILEIHQTMQHYDDAHDYRDDRQHDTRLRADPYPQQHEHDPHEHNLL